MKRFYKEVTANPVDGGWQVTLDGRGIKTVKGAQQIVPSEAMAQAMAAEWDAQGEKINPASFVFRDMVDYAIDVVASDPTGLVEKVSTYGDTDTLLYRADPDEPLFARQQELWEPIVTGFEQRHGIELVRVSGIVHRPQGDAAMARLRERLLEQNPFVLAAIEAKTTLAASLVIGLSASVADAEAEALELWQAACLEEEWQADLWGRDYEAEERRERRRADFLNAWRMARLAAG